jgi:hypothetical protein
LGFWLLAFINIVVVSNYFRTCKYDMPAMRQTVVAAGAVAIV